MVHLNQENAHLMEALGIRNMSGQEMNERIIMVSRETVMGMSEMIEIEGLTEEITVDQKSIRGEVDVILGLLHEIITLEQSVEINETIAMIHLKIPRCLLHINAK